MAGQSLYEIVSNALKDTNQKGKSSIGYTVSNYSGVLEDLENIKTVYKDVVIQGAQGENSVTPLIRNQYTKLGKTGLQGGVDNQGFIELSGGKVSYQAQVEVKAYMSYVVEDSNESTGKIQRCFVAVTRDTLDNGIILQQGGGNPSYPPSVLQESVIKSMGTALDGQTNPCKIGVGISFSTFGLMFFKKFFEKMNWTATNIEALAAKGYLFAEVLFPKSKSSAWSFHSMVTVKREILGNGNFQVWMPIPILLLNDFSALGKVIMTNTNGKQAIVGQGKTIYPLAGSKYNHKDCSISGFTPSFLRGFIMSTENNSVSHKMVTLCNQGLDKVTKARVRLYFDQSAKDEITNHVGSIPQQYQVQLFRGLASPSDIVQIKETIETGIFIGSVMDTCRYEPNQVDWEWIKTSSWKPYYQYKNDIEKACKDNDLNVRLFLAHSAYETGYLGESKGWTAGLYNTGGLLYPKPDATIDGAKYGLSNVTLKSSKIPSTGNDGKGGTSIHGYFIDFQTPYNGFFAHCYKVATSSNYGFKTFNLQTVSQYANALQNGVNGNPSYCANCPEYAETIERLYKKIKGGNG